MVNGDMDDVTFLNYCTLHSTTPRALFHERHVKRLHELADVECPKLEADCFYTLREDIVHPLIARALERKEKKNAE